MDSKTIPISLLMILQARHLLEAQMGQFFCWWYLGSLLQPQSAWSPWAAHCMVTSLTSLVIGSGVGWAPFVQPHGSGRVPRGKKQELQAFSREEQALKTMTAFPLHFPDQSKL